MASLGSVQAALRCAVNIQRGLAAHNDSHEPALKVRIGISAGEPVAEGDDLFGATVQLAARLCDHAEPGTILVSGVVRDLAIGKGFTFGPGREASLKGFPQPGRAVRGDLVLGAVTLRRPRWMRRGCRQAFGKEGR